MDISEEFCDIINFLGRQSSQILCQASNWVNALTHFTEEMCEFIQTTFSEIQDEKEGRG
jgi:hypothetical protein